MELTLCTPGAHGEHQTEAATPAAPVEVKRKKRPNRATKPQLLLREKLDQRLAARQYMDRLAADIQRDLGGKDQLSTIELSLIEAFVSSTITMSAMSAKLALGEAIDFSTLAQTIGAMVRVASRLGIQRRSRDITTPSVEDYLAHKAKQREAENGDGGSC